MTTHRIDRIFVPSTTVFTYVYV